MTAPTRAAPGRQLSLLAAFALALMAAGLASAKKFTPPAALTAAPGTPRLSSMRASATGVAQTWTSQPVKSSYESFLRTMRKPPTSLSSTSKQATFKANLATIMARNANTKLRWTAAANFFTDMSATERAHYLGIRGRRSKSAAVAALRNTTQSLAAIAAEVPPPVAAAAAAASVHPNGMVAGVPEWSVALPDIKDQGSCGSCWAFAATSITEAGHYINTGEVLALSEKQLVDCNYPDNHGCEGGTYDPAFKYVIANGQATADAYPYTAVRNTCPANRPAAASRLAAYKQLESGNEDAMLAALKDGPIAVAVTADNGWFDYAGGVYSSSACVGGDPNHAVVIVGAGVDSESQTPYWLIRNSWGAIWGESGYMRLQRGVGGNGMCNVAQAPYQAVSADQGSNTPPPPPPPVDGCQGPSTITVTSSTSLKEVSIQYKTSISQIMLDNNLNWRTLFTDGQQLTINCPTGTWSPPYGVWDGVNSGNGMSEIPTVAVCPPGSYAVSFYVKPSQWYNGNRDFTGSTWVGTITMTCSDGTNQTLDAQPGFNPGWADGTQTQITGFTNATFNAYFTVESLFGVGVASGGEKLSFSCPDDTLITGFSGGTATSIKVGGTDSVYPKGWVNNLQFLCQNPFGQGIIPKQKVLAIRKVAPRFPRLRSGLSCTAQVVQSGDTWMSIAAKYPKVGLNELMRSNPSIAGTTLPVGKRVFIPPCVDGVVYGTRAKSSRDAAAAAAPAEPIAAAAAADAKPAAAAGLGSDAAGVVVPAIAPDTWA